MEDNATARTNMRSHLLAVDNFEIASYSNGNELKNGLRLNNFDFVIMDFHLGQSKNGVEWINQLNGRKLFKPSTGLVFVTSDSLPQTIGQILDLHPDFILIKPYTIKSLRTNLTHYLKLRKETLPILQAMENEEYAHAINMIAEKLEKNNNKRFRNDFLKLKGRLLLADKRYADAANLYSSILQKSSNVLWAHWGLIKSEYLIGNWEQCQILLNHLISESLTKDKAFEWLASVAIGKSEFKEAESLLDNIKDGELSIQATRLKVLSYNMQEYHDKAKTLLERKVQSNLSVKDRMSDYAIELARFYIQMAELVSNSESSTAIVNESIKIQNGNNKQHALTEEKQESLLMARKLINKAKHSTIDRQSELQKDYLLALAYVVEGDFERAEKIVEQTETTDFLNNAKTSTMIDAVKVWFGVGQTNKAKEILLDCDEHLLKQDNHIERLICSEKIGDIEESNHLQKERALQSNEKGTKFYRVHQYHDALICFAKSYKMFPGIPAFSLNLLQCLSDLEKYEFQGIHAEALYNELQSVALSEKNQVRLKRIKAKLSL